MVGRRTRRAVMLEARCGGLPRGMPLRRHGRRPMENGVVALRRMLREQRCGEQQAGGKCENGNSIEPEHNHYSVGNLS